jgi:hypothetical protein
LPSLLSNPYPPPSGPIDYPGIAQQPNQQFAFAADTHGGVGTDYFAEITNTGITIYDKYRGFKYRKGNSQYPTHDDILEVFFSQTPDQAAVDATFQTPDHLFDPRAVKDPVSRRWIAVAMGIPRSNGSQYLYVAVSKTEDARREWYVFSPFPIPLATRNVADFPMLGVDGDAVLVTLQIGPGGGISESSTLLALRKSTLFNGFGGCLNFIQGLARFLTPPIVRDSATNSFLVAPVLPGPSTSLKMYRGQNLGETQPVLSQLPDVPVPTYSSPGRINQCGSGAPLNVGDGRFVNASTQVGKWLWQTHTITASVPARPRFYELDTSGSTPFVNRSSDVYASATSRDFNATIVADDEDATGAGSVAFMTWSSVEPGQAPCRGPQIRYGGLRPTETADQMRPGAEVPIPNTQAFSESDPGEPDGTPRWGDYSAIAIDPSDDATSPLGSCKHRAWLVNEVGAGILWKSQWAAVGICT